MTSSALRKKFLDFFKAQGHAVVPSSSLLPDDPSVLLTTAGMQQFKKYFTGELDAKKDFILPNGQPAVGTASIQKCFRTSDIDEVGDETHLTFFEMMGNFSFGGYFKEDAIRYAKDFLDLIDIKIDHVTVFQGDSEVEQDKDSIKIWNSLGFSEEKGNLKLMGREDNFWGPTGNEGPCGPTTEIYAGGIEIWNIVFNQYFGYWPKPALQEVSNSIRQHPAYLSSTVEPISLRLKPLPLQGVDTGMGLERLAMVSQGKSNIFETDLFASLKAFLPANTHPVALRRTLDHIRGIGFLLADGMRPSKKEAGYVLRRLIRKTVLYESRYQFSEDAFRNMLEAVIREYGDFYNELKENENSITEVFMGERKKFKKLVSEGRQRIRKLIEAKEIEPKFAVKMREDFGSKSTDFIKMISGDEAFDIYQTYGFPPELIEDELAQYAYTYHKEEFQRAFEKAQEKHREISRAGRERKFGGHGLLLDTGELKAANEEELKIVTRLHTATHLLQSALRKTLGDTVHQAGSDITAERLRFDFTFDRKLTPEEIKEIEDWVNMVVQKDVSMGYKELPYEEAIKTGALYFEKEKYPAVVKVYSAADPKTGEVFSKELCGGPHVSRTSELGRFKITKEESVGAGVRRIRAIVE